LPGMVVELCDFPQVRGEASLVSESKPVLSLGLSSLLPLSEGRFSPGPYSGFARFGPLHFRPMNVPLEVHYDSGCFSTIRCVFEADHFAKMTGLPDEWSAEQLAACLDIRHAGLEDVMLRMSEECAVPSRGSEELIGCFGAAALVYLARYLREARQRSEISCGGLSSHHLRKITAYIQGAVEPPSVTDLAALCRLSRHHFMRAFRRSTGITVAKYVEAIRISQAKNLLVSSPLTISEIASELRFSSVGSFSTVFRRATGRSPTNYRAQMR
jgi:AraC family transcriptional regulator